MHRNYKLTIFHFLTELCCRPITLFVGVDGTRAFASGDFTDEGLIEDISGLIASDVEAIESFRKMYANDYRYAGISCI